MVKNSQPKIVTMTPSFATVQIIKKLVGGIISVRTVISMVSITGKIGREIKSLILYYSSGGKYSSNYNDGIYWTDWKGGTYSLKYVTMKLRPKS